MDIVWIVFWVWLVGFFASAFIYVRLGPFTAVPMKSDTPGDKLADALLAGLIILLMSIIWPLTLAGYLLYKLATIGMKQG